MSANRIIPMTMTLMVCGCMQLHTPTAQAQEASAKPSAVSTPPMRGTPFAEITGMKPIGGKEYNHIVYLMDTSGSMRDGDKDLKLMKVVKRTLLDLRPTDTFNIITFDYAAHAFSTEMADATQVNIKKASAFIDALKLKPYTNFSDALEQALHNQTVTQIFLMSDGEPNTGIQDFTKLRQFVKAKNTRQVHINPIALGIGERFPGMRLMKGLAEDNDGQYSYINLSNNTALPDKK